MEVLQMKNKYKLFIINFIYLFICLYAILNVPLNDIYDKIIYGIPLIFLIGVGIVMTFVTIDQLKKKK